MKLEKKMEEGQGQEVAHSCGGIGVLWTSTDLIDLNMTMLAYFVTYLYMTLIA